MIGSFKECPALGAIPTVGGVLDHVTLPMGVADALGVARQ
jgi:hypothetical protein